MTDTDQPQFPDNVRLPWMGMPLGYGGLPPTGIHPPNLTDSSLSGVYHATLQVPSQARQALNAVSAKIGAPALAGGSAPTLIKQVYAETPTVGAVTRRVPVFARQAMSTFGAQVRALRARLNL